MPIPLFLIALGAGAAALGVGKSIKAGVDMKDAKETNNLAQNIIDQSKEEADKSRKIAGKAIKNLGQEKYEILSDSISPFIESFNKLHNIELSESTGLDEIKNFKIDKASFEELKDLRCFTSSVLSGAVGGLTASAATALGALGLTTTFATASTGTAIATLSGAAATNATLAFLGGGALSAGGLGVAGGTAVLGGLVAGPALAIFGFVIGSKASANKDRAYANLAKSEEFEEQMKTVKVVCKGIRMRANMFERALIQLNSIFMPLVYELEKIISESGTDFSKYNKNEKCTVAAGLSTALAIKSVLDVPILTEDGALTQESEYITDKAQLILDANR